MSDLTKAMFQATEAYPYYARGFAALTPIRRLIKVNGHPTLGVDQWWRLYWSPEALEAFRYHLPHVLRHELEHLLRDHAHRRTHRQPRPWNIVADAEINDDIEGLPAGTILPKDLECEDGLTAEEYYSRLPIIEVHSGADGTEGSGVTGVPEEWEEAPGDTDTTVDEVAAEVLRDAVASDVVSQAKSRGDVPDSVLVWAEARARGRLPRISWCRVVGDRLRRIVHGRQDWSYARPSRRQDSRDRILLPATVAYKPSVGVIIDTSGSMSDAADWVAGILRDLTRLNAGSTLIDCDAAVHGVRPLAHWRDVLRCRGGGGTDMRVGVDYAVKRRFDMVLVLTDGETPWPDPWPRRMIAVVKNGDRSEVRVG